MTATSNPLYSDDPELEVAANLLHEAIADAMVNCMFGHADKIYTVQFIRKTESQDPCFEINVNDRYFKIMLMRSVPDGR